MNWGVPARRRIVRIPPRRSATTMDDIHDAFVHAVERRVGGDVQVGVSLSGGYDSRTLLAAINHKQHRVKTLTLDVPGGADQQIAERVARHTNGLHNHRFVENSASLFAGWPQYVRDMVSLTDGMYYDEACVMMPTLDIYRDMGVQVLLRGHAGELARMHEAYELRCNRHVLACRTQAQLRSRMLGQLTVCSGNRSWTTFLCQSWPGRCGAPHGLRWTRPSTGLIRRGTWWIRQAAYMSSNTCGGSVCHRSIDFGRSHYGSADALPRLGLREVRFAAAPANADYQQSAPPFAYSHEPSGPLTDHQR